MHRSLVLFTFLLSAATVPALSQSVSPNAPAASAQSATSSAATIKANAELVVVDVVVTDSSHKPVHGLKAADFKLTENSAPQVVKQFEEHTSLTTADATKFAPMPKLPLGVFTNYTPTPTNGAVNLVLLDSLNTPMKDQAYVRQQLLAYLKTVPPGTRIAIFGLTSRLTILQGFTSDPEVLKALLARGLGKASPLLDDQVGGGGIQNSAADDMEDNDVDPTIVANLRQFEAQTQTFQLQVRAQFTLDAMNSIARYLAGIPGRKNLIWFSGSFPIDILPDITGTLPDPFAAMASSEDEFRDTVDLLARSQVAVYPIDARGLFNSPAFDASTSRNYTGPRGQTRINQDQTKFFTDTAEEHHTMYAMADATGGHAFVDTNGLTKAVAEAIDDGSNFYTLTYSPASYRPDGKLHKIKVELDRQGLSLAYRHGYYADSPDSAKIRAPLSSAPESAISNTAGPTSQQSMHMAIARGAPTPSEIVMEAGVVPMTPANHPEDNLAPGNMPAAKIHGPYRRYSVNYLVNPADLAFFKTPDGKIHVDIDLIIFVYDQDGAAVNSMVSTLHITEPVEEIKKLIAQGIYRHEEISVPAKGEYFLRIAVHDLHRDHYGAVEVATSQVRNVVASTPPPPPPPPASTATPAPK